MEHSCLQEADDSMSFNLLALLSTSSESFLRASFPQLGTAWYNVNHGLLAAPLLADLPSLVLYGLQDHNEYHGSIIVCKCKVYLVS